MPTLLLRFPGGRYHATPWGHHVNEGLVEWPPSPWRVLRALIAVGYATEQWTGIPPKGRVLIEALAETLPRYILPAAALAQSRHYMPLTQLDGGRERTTLVFDTWARVGDGELAITWDAELPPDAHALLGTLVAKLGYLGRSESWVEARLLEPWEPLPQGSHAWPLASGEPPRLADGRLEPGWEQVELLAPEPVEPYVAWRDDAVAAALEPFPLPEGGRKPGAKLLKERAGAEAPFPADLLDCLQVDSSWVQRFGWSQPPGSRRVMYWRRIEALEVGPPRRLEAGRSGGRVEAMLLALSTPTGNLHALPPQIRSLSQAERIHKDLVRTLARDGRIPEALELVGRDMERQPLTGHQHAHVLLLDLDDDQHLEHILVWAPMGLGEAAQAAIRDQRRTFMKGGVGEVRLAVAGMGSLEGLRQLRGPLGVGFEALLGPEAGARVWESQTPFVPPRYLKPRGKNSLEGQVHAELACRGLPEAKVTLLGPDQVTDLRLRHFVRVRKHGPMPPVDVSFGLRLTFDVPVRGPLCLGYGSHFSLGQFKAIVA